MKLIMNGNCHGSGSILTTSLNMTHGFAASISLDILTIEFFHGVAYLIFSNNRSIVNCSFIVRVFLCKTISLRFTLNVTR